MWTRAGHSADAVAHNLPWRRDGRRCLHGGKEPDDAGNGAIIYSGNPQMTSSITGNGRMAAGQ